MNLRIRILHGIIPVLLFSSGALAERKVAQLKEGMFSIYGSGNILFTNTKAHEITGADFTAKYTNPILLNVGMRLKFLGFLSFGLRYEYWLAHQQFTLDGVSNKDVLSLQGVGPEMGIQWGNPRAQYALLASMMYPLNLKVTRTGAATETYEAASNPYYFLFRLLITIKFSSKLGFLMETGYRQADFGDLQSDGTSYISDGSHLSFSGPFFGVGMSFHF